MKSTWYKVYNYGNKKKTVDEEVKPTMVDLNNKVLNN